MSKNVEKLWLLALLFTPFILWILPANFFDGEEGIILCPSRRFFNIECFGCGLSRAIMHLHHFDFENAAFYNIGSFVIYIGLIYVWFIWVKNTMTSLGFCPFKKLV
jgi:hypothetical protein